MSLSMPRPGDDRSRVRIGERRAVAQELRHDMQAVGAAAPPPRGRPPPAAARPASIDRQRTGPPARARRRASGAAGCIESRLFDGRARHRLAAFVEPRVGHHRREIRPPDAGHEDRLAGRGHRARRGAEDVGEARLGRRPRRRPCRCRPHAHRSRPAATGVPARRPSSAAALARQPVAERRARLDDAAGRCARSPRPPARRGRRCGNSSRPSAARARDRSTCR